MMSSMDGVAGHRERVRHALVELGIAGAWPAVLTDPRLPRSALLSGVLVLLAETAQDDPDVGPVVTVVGAEDPDGDWLGRSRVPWEYLARQRLPWTPLTATTAVRLVTGNPAFDDRRVALALRGAGQVCSAGRADVDLLDALAALRHYLDHVEEWVFRLKELRAVAARVVASATPPDLLDLSALADGDTWAGPARAAARDAPAEVAAALVRLLVELGPRKPSRRWQRDVEEVLADPAARLLLRRWIEAAGCADIVPDWPGGSLEDNLGTLFVGTNTDIVRAAVWASVGLTSEDTAGTDTSTDVDWPLEQQLGVLARRGSAHNGLPRFPEALSIKVATAAVDVLIARGGPEALRVLSELLEDLQRRDLLKKVGAALDRQDEAAVRESQLLTQRALEQRRKASPAPRKARAAMDSLIREHLGATLRRAGFKGGPRTWRRAHDDRVDVIAVSTWMDPESGRNELHLTYGTRLDALHETEHFQPGNDTSRYPAPVDRAKTSELDLDLRVFEYAGNADDDPIEQDGDQLDGTSAAGMAASARRLVEVVVPFLDSLGAYERVRCLLAFDEGIPPGAGLAANLGSPARLELLGRMALSHADKATAVASLTAAADLASTQLRETPGPGEDWARKRLIDLERWLAQARDLP